MRDYEKIFDRLNQLDLPLDIIGTVNNYPIYQIHLKSSTDDNPNVLITSGIHGDEPAGIEAALKFLSRDNNILLQEYNFVVLPCINPYGYVHDVRDNSDRKDINRSFETEDVSEAEIVKSALGRDRFIFTIDFHEDYDAAGFYLYEGKRDGQYICPEIAKIVKSVGPIDTEDSGEDTTAIAENVYKVNPKWGTQGLAPYLLHFHTEHVIITETPTKWPLNQRVALHIAVLDAALSYYSKDI